jgi:hypothetical protein
MAMRFAEVAETIGNSRLEKPLRRLAENVKIEVYEATPPLAEVKRGVERVKADARRFEAALRRVSALDLTFGAAEALLKLRGLMADKIIPEVTTLSNKTLSRRSGKRGPKRKPNPSKLTCALIVIEAWTFAKGKAPSANNERAQEACEAYWRACTGGPSVNWQRILKSARIDQSRWRSYVRGEIRRGAE